MEKPREQESFKLRTGTFMGPRIRAELPRSARTAVAPSSKLPQTAGSQPSITLKGAPMAERPTGCCRPPTETFTARPLTEAQLATAACSAFRWGLLLSSDLCRTLEMWVRPSQYLVLTSQEQPVSVSMALLLLSQSFSLTKSQPQCRPEPPLG